MGKRIAFLVSGGGTNMQAVLDGIRRGTVGQADPALVLSSRPGVRALERAAAFGIPCRVIERSSCPDETEYSRRVLDALREFSIDLVVLAGFLTILGRETVEVYRHRMINVHPSLIPSFCGKGFYGLKVHQAALEYGVKVTGATVHFVEEEADAGPIILQKAVEVLEDDTPETLQRRVMEQAEWVLLPKAVDLICRGKVAVDGRRVKILE